MPDCAAAGGHDADYASAGIFPLGRFRPMTSLAFGAAWRRWILAMAFASLAAGAALAAGRYEGVASCAGSTCHGRVEGNGAVVRQDELRLWQEPSQRSGAHSRAYQALLSPRGQRIASTLGLGGAGSAAASPKPVPATGPAPSTPPPSMPWPTV